MNNIQDDLAAFGPTVRRYRERAGYSQAELAGLMNSSRNTVINWETNRARPDLPTTRALGVLLGISAGELLCMEEAASLTPVEERLLKRFRDLSSDGQRLACRLVAAVVSEEASAEERRMVESHMVLPLYTTPVAAGVGYSWSDHVSPDYCILKRSAAGARADMTVRVKGDSMEPVYHSGQLLYVRRGQEARPGDDVVCTTENGPVVKRVNRDGRLYSVNPDLPFGEHYEDDHVQLLGRVIGSAEDDLPTRAQLPMLEELLADEITRITRS